MPSYRSAQYPEIAVKVRPTGYRRLWPIRWWWPYFQGSSVTLHVTFESKRTLTFDAWVNHGDSEDMARNLAIPVGKSSQAIRYPQERILPSSPCEIAFTLRSAGTEERDQLRHGMTAAQFRAWDMDEMVMGRVVPTMLMATAVVAAGLVGWFLRG